MAPKETVKNGFSDRKLLATSRALAFLLTVNGLRHFPGADISAFLFTVLPATALLEMLPLGVTCLSLDVAALCTRDT